MVFTLLRHEILSIVKNKRYILSLSIQLLLIFALIPLFSTFLSTGTISISTPALSEFVPVGVVDESSNSDILKDALEDNSKIDLQYFDSFDARSLVNGKVAAIIIIPSEYDESLNKVLNVLLVSDPSNLKYRALADAIAPSIQEASRDLGKIRMEVFGVSVEEPVKAQKNLLRPVIIENRQARFSSFFFKLSGTTDALFPYLHSR